MKVPAVLKNKYLFYALAVLAALNVIGYASVKAYECLALFLLAGYGMHCYCKNKSLAILAALFVANFVFGCGRVKEGMEDMMKDPKALLQEASAAAAKAGEQLSNQGQEGMADVCAALSIDANTAASDCTGIQKADGSGPADCQWTAPTEGKCSVGEHSDQQACEGANGQWTAPNEGSCVMPSPSQ